MSFPRYPSYKPSDIDWLGEVPAHWEKKPLYSSATERNESNKGMINDNLLSLSYGRIVRKDISLNDGLLPESFETYQVVRPGDIVFRPTDLQNDWRSLRSAIVEETGIITSAYIAVTPRGPDSRYMSHLFRSYDAMKVFYSMGGGLRQSMKYSDLKRLPIILPPLAEQTAIAEFLDRETGKIDELVAEQRRLMELLKEKRQAVISHAVTRGLNPAAPLKPSGIEWLGDVPAHWEIRKMSHFFRAGKGKNGQMLTKEFCGANPGDYPVYSGQTENDGIMGTWDQFEFDFGEKGVLFSTTVRARAMHLRQLFGRFSLSQNCMIIWSTSERCETRFYYYHFQPLFQFERALIPEHMQASFRIEDLYGYKVAVPPVDEQLAISAHLDAKTAKFDALTAEAQRAIDLLQERRTALISAAVTGQIDVRTAGL